jgi:hypothetical protein
MQRIQALFTLLTTQFFSHSSGAWQSKIKVPADSFSGERSLHAFSL